MNNLHRAWVGEQAQLMVTAPELRAVDDPPPSRFATTATGARIGRSYSRVSADPGSIQGPFRPPPLAVRAARWLLKQIARTLGSMRALLVVTAVVSAALLLTACSGPSEIETARAVAAQVEDGRIDEWVQAARRANPNLTQDDVARVRAAAGHIEQNTK